MWAPVVQVYLMCKRLVSGLGTQKLGHIGVPPECTVLYITNHAAPCHAMSVFVGFDTLYIQELSVLFSGAPMNSSAILSEELRCVRGYKSFSTYVMIEICSSRNLLISKLRQ